MSQQDVLGLRDESVTPDRQCCATLPDTSLVVQKLVATAICGELDSFGHRPEAGAYAWRHSGGQATRVHSAARAATIFAQHVESRLLAHLDLLRDAQAKGVHATLQHSPLCRKVPLGRGSDQGYGKGSLLAGSDGFVWREQGAGAGDEGIAFYAAKPVQIILRPGFGTGVLDRDEHFHGLSRVHDARQCVAGDASICGMYAGIGGIVHGIGAEHWPGGVRWRAARFPDIDHGFSAIKVGACGANYFKLTVQVDV